MEGREKKKSAESGVTLVEVMISILVFSVMLGMASSFVKEGMERPFVALGVEGWLNLIEESARLSSNFDSERNVKSISIEDIPYSKVIKPKDLKSWTLNWKNTNLPNVHAAEFQAKSTNNQVFNWTIYKVVND